MDIAEQSLTLSDTLVDYVHQVGPCFEDALSAIFRNLDTSKCSELVEKMLQIGIHDLSELAVKLFRESGSERGEEGDEGDH
jgi:hypothetical protein